MKVSELMVQLEMNAWHRFIFYAVNIPRFLVGKDLAILKCMYKGDGFDVLKKIKADLDDKNGQADA